MYGVGQHGHTKNYVAGHTNCQSQECQSIAIYLVSIRAATLYQNKYKSCMPSHTVSYQACFVLVGLENVELVLCFIYTHFGEENLVDTFVKNTDWLLLTENKCKYYEMRTTVRLLCRYGPHLYLSLNPAHKPSRKSCTVSSSSVFANFLRYS